MFSSLKRRFKEKFHKFYQPLWTTVLGWTLLTWACFPLWSSELITTHFAKCLCNTLSETKAKKIIVKHVRLLFCFCTVSQCLISMVNKSKSKSTIFSRKTLSRSCSKKLSVKLITSEKEPPWINFIIGWTNQLKSCTFVVMVYRKSKTISFLKITSVKVSKWILKP